jgi:predicted HTH domain antitoxin
MNVTLEINEELEAILHEVEPDGDRALLVEAVCGLYARNRVGGGQGARLLGMDRFEFQEELAKRQIPMNYGLKELKEDLEFAGGK